MSSPLTDTAALLFIQGFQFARGNPIWKQETLEDGKIAFWPEIDGKNAFSGKEVSDDED